jgi:hypothetical protein
MFLCEWNIEANKSFSQLIQNIPLTQHPKLYRLIKRENRQTNRVVTGLGGFNSRPATALVTNMGFPFGELCAEINGDGGVR